MAAIPEPGPGLVIHYDYLWRREQSAAQANARKSRPCVIVVARRVSEDGRTIVAVAPVTHQAPRAGTDAVEMPPAVKRHLGLDHLRSWIVTDEFNEFEWPGFDLQPNASGEFVYGFIPPRLYEQVRLRLLRNLEQQRLGRVSR